MIKSHEPLRVAGALPSAYQEVLYWKLSEKPSRMIFVQALALVGMFIFGLLFTSLAIGMGKLPLSGSFSLGLGQAGAMFTGIALTLVAHELTHGLAMWLFGATPTYGFLWRGMMLYATTPGYAYRRNSYLVVALAPLALISALVVLGLWLLPGWQWAALLVLCGVVNASGASGDLWMTRIALGYPAAAFIMDERDGMRVFLPKP